ncbi:MAG: UDP-N-acetylglucosamine 2-epimerase (non-hydrolyzing) [Bacteroidia bacterium]|nr:UDP-N-acetylglucosamine 2-epimerase (non-hydrolyzing) [Bacteroidia bacterium]
MPEEKKILIVFGTRPEVIKLAPLILDLKNSSLKDRFIVASTSQHEELLEEQLNFWKIKPDYFLTPSPFKGDLVRMLSHTLSGLQDIIDQVGKVEFIVVQGDTNTALACSNLAFLNKIKLIHVEAGLRSFDLEHPFPEEFNRSVASKVAYFHFAPTELSKQNLLNEKVDESKIMVIGNTVIDALNYVKNSQEKIINGQQKTILITIHRRENIIQNYLTLVDIVGELADEHPDFNFIWITHPNGMKTVNEKKLPAKNIKIYDHMSYNDFINLYESASLVITDSGGVSEEAIHLGLPLIVFRLKTERVEAIDINYPLLISIKKDEIRSFFKTTISTKNILKYSYGDGRASLKIKNWLIKEMEERSYEVVIVGGGPAGTGLLLKCLKDGMNNSFMKKSVALIERSECLIKGNITKYKVNSDTFSDVFLECLEGATHELINTDELKNEIEYIRNFKGRSIPLEDLDSYYSKLGILLKKGLEANKHCDFFMKSTVTKIIQQDSGIFRVFISGHSHPIKTKQLIIATGGIPFNFKNKEVLFSEKIVLNNFLHKSIHSDELLRNGMPEMLKAELTKKTKVVILGGSHSAFSAAHLLLNSTEKNKYDIGDIKIWSKSLPKIYFPTQEDAIKSGYTDFTEQDICPVTKKLYRLAGLRMDGRDLYIKMLGLNNSDKEQRVELKTFSDQYAQIENDLKEATLIILAYGYKLNMFPFYDSENKIIKFKGEDTNHWVNKNCAMLDAHGKVIPNLFATGLATGFIPSGKLGGEPSFEGQTNGIWYYQNAIAEEIISNLQNENPSNMS